MARKDDILSIYTKEVEGIKEAIHYWNPGR